MKIDVMIINVVNDYVEDYGVEGVMDELFPGLSFGEIVKDMFWAGLIPEDVLEKFLES